MADSDRGLIECLPPPDQPAMRILSIFLLILATTAGLIPTVLGLLFAKPVVFGTGLMLLAVPLVMWATVVRNARAADDRCLVLDPRRRTVRLERFRLSGPFWSFGERVACLECSFDDLLAARPMHSRHGGGLTLVTTRGVVQVPGTFTRVAEAGEVLQKACRARGTPRSRFSEHPQFLTVLGFVLTGLIFAGLIALGWI